MADPAAAEWAGRVPMVHMPRDRSIVRACQMFPALVMAEDSSGVPSSPGTVRATFPNALFELVMVIGGVASGVVFLARNLLADAREAKFVAVKFVELGGRSEADRNRALAEVHCLLNCSFFSILRCHRDFLDYDGQSQQQGHENAIALVLDYANAGDLRQEIKGRRKTNRTFKEHEAGLLFLQVLMAINYLHSKHMLHRDIKSANVLLCTNGIIKLGDFGFSKIYKGSVSGEVGNTFCGTPYYVAPEIWKKVRYSKKAEMYSLGVLLYELLTLNRPFDGDDLTKVREEAISAPVPSLPQEFSQEMRDLVTALMAKDPADRPTTEAVLATPLMKLLTSALLEIAHSKQTDIADVDREQIIQDVENLRRHALSPPKAIAPVRRPHLLHMVPSNSTLSVSASPNVTLGSTTSLDGVGPSVVMDDNILMESMIFKGSGESMWKKRYLCLVRHPVTKTVDLLLSVSKASVSVQCVRKSLSDFEDVFPVPERYTSPPLPFSFALMTANGKKLAFRAESQEDLDLWVAMLGFELHQARANSGTVAEPQ
jgi:serine/threonine protein kinase